MKPLIGISTSSQGTNEALKVKRTTVNKAYSDSVYAAGGLPVLLPDAVSSDIEEIVSRLDGLILSGGYDVNPRLYNEDPHPKLTTYSVERDTSDFLYLEEFLRQDKPVLGICRGMQVINVFMKGSLYQDLSLHPTSNILHLQVTDSDQVSHRVNVEDGSKIKEIYQEDVVWVNSYHHQAVKEVGEGLEVTCISTDGVIEAIEGTKHKFLVGVQWHPELLAFSHEEHLNIFKSLVESAKN